MASSLYFLFNAIGHLLFYNELYERWPMYNLLLFTFIFVFGHRL